MSARRAHLQDVADGVLQRLRNALARGHVALPLTRASLVAIGIRNQLDAIEATFAELDLPACLTVLDAVLAERENRKPAPELVWTGPEAASALSRDTAIVLRELFESARESVILAGYAFRDTQKVLAPLYRTMQARPSLDVRFFVDVPRNEGGENGAAHVRGYLDRFMTTHWPFGDPKPRVYYDKRAFDESLYCSLHAKCVVVDGARAFISSANFTERGQERNIEVGVVIRDAGFAAQLAGQWLGLIEAGLVGQWGEAL